MKIPTPVIAFLLSLAAPLSAAVLPLDDFIRHGDYLDLTLSPDGEHLLARVRQQSTVMLVFVRRKDGAVVGGVKPGGGDMIHSASWVNNKRILYQLAEKSHALDRPVPTGELYAINIDGSASKLIYGYRASDEATGTRISLRESSNASHEILTLLPDDRKHILIIEYPWQQIGGYWYDNRSRPPVVSRLNVYTGRKKKIEVITHNGARVLADEGGRVRFASWVDKNGEQKSAFRHDNKEKWQELAPLLDIDEAPYPIAVDAAANRGYLLGNYGDRRLQTLFELDMSSGKVTRLFDGLRADLLGWETDIDTPAPVVGISYPDRPQYHYADTDSPMIAIHKMLARAFKGQELAVTSRSADGKLLLLRVSSDINPGEYYIFDVEAKKADFLWANRSWIDPRQMRPVQPVALQSRDGIPLHGYLTLPARDGAAPEQKKPALVVVLHGGPHGVRDYWSYNSEVQLLANRGYAVLQINFRGSAGYGEAFEQLGYRQWGGKMIEDIIDATRWAAQHAAIDGNRICVYGASYGGYAALMAAARAADLYRCAVGYAGIYDLEYMYTKGDIPDLWGGEAYLETVIGRDEGQLQAFSPIHHVDNIKAAVMLIHGENDRRVPIAHAKAMRSKLKKSAKEVTWLSYGKSGHGVWDLNSRRELYQGLLDFLARHID